MGRLFRIYTRSCASVKKTSPLLFTTQQVSCIKLHTPQQPSNPTQHIPLPPRTTPYTMFSSTKVKSLRSSSRSAKHTSSIYDGRMSFSSDSSTLLNVGIPSYPTKIASSKIGPVTEDDMLDPEDRAWGPPPQTNFKWSMPKFSRKSSSRS